jgi:IclR family transcriptional regulator, KDG regulon repressor
MSVPSIRFARTQARGLADHLMACARDASVTLGYRVGAAAAGPSPMSTIKRRRPE